MLISVFFLAIQIEYKPYDSAEHNWIATLACTQITVTLLMVALQATGLPISIAVAFFCILFNVVIVPLVLVFNARRLKCRHQVLSALSLQRVANEEPSHQDVDQMQSLNPSDLEEAWKAGKKSELEIFTAALEWIDVALERPVDHHRWEQILFLLEQMPLMDSAHGDARYGEQ